MRTEDEFRFAFASPMAFVMQAVKAQLTGDTGTIETLFGQITRGALWEAVAVVALSELAMEISEHRGDDALA